MSTQQFLRDTLNRTDISRSDKLLVILADSRVPIPVSDIRKAATAAGLHEAGKWNVSQILSRSKELATRVKDGWTLTTQGREHIRRKDLYPATKAPKNVIPELRKHLSSISSTDTRNFVEEAISCFEHELYRSAVVLSWVGAVSLLYDHIVKYELGSFNTEARHRDPKWRNAKTVDDLARMKEFDFLEILQAISVIGRNVKQELNNCLRLRNGCGHPSSLSIGQQRVAAHLEVLILNVFSKFA